MSTLGPARAKPDKPWYWRAWKNLRKRWVQVTIVMLAGLLVAGLSWQVLAPTIDPKADRAAGRYKFLHCDHCNTELAYNPDLDGKRCPKCPPPNTGFYVPTEASIKSSWSGKSPWRWAYLAVAVEVLAALGGVVYLLYLPVADPTTTFFVCNCPHCGQRLRFRQVALGGLGQCSRCKRPLRFPDEDEAVLEADLVRAETERLEARAAEEEDEDED